MSTSVKDSAVDRLWRLHEELHRIWTGTKPNANGVEYSPEARNLARKIRDELINVINGIEDIPF